MIEHTFDTAHSILYVRLKDSLKQGDFAELAKTVDPYIEQTGDLAGIIIEAPTFPGWESLGAMAAQFRFARDHHKHIKKVGLVTDSALGKVAEHLASHFVSAEIRHCPAARLEAAKQWVMNRP
jgi:SpoIIAA-like